MLVGGEKKERREEKERKEKKEKATTPGKGRKRYP